MRSYAQNGEDVVLRRAFADQATGFYIDIGACHPVEDSVTLYFYERGWHGVNVEPDHALHAEFLLSRPRDINLCTAVAQSRGRAAFHPTGTRGHGTLDADLASARSDGRPAERVPTLPLSDVIDCHGPDTGDIDFLKIDVEGLEAAVIASGDWTRHRPRVLVIEAVDDEGRPTHEAWEPALLEARYIFALFDGLNRFYARAEESALLLPRLAAPANVRDFWVRARDEQAHATAARLQAELADAARLAAEAEDRSLALGADLEDAYAGQSQMQSHIAAAEAEAARIRAESAESLAAAGREMQARIAAAEAETARSRAESAKSLAAVEQEMQRRIEAAEAEAARLRSEIAETVQRHEKLAAEASRARAEVSVSVSGEPLAVVAARARAEAAAALRREEAAEARMAELEMDAIRREAEGRALRGWADAVKTSTSWRVTKPLRAAKRLARRLRARRLRGAR
jgi:FkbM family methyltransferase